MSINITVKSEAVRKVAEFAVDSLSCQCRNGQIEKFWREDRAYSSHFRQHLGPKTKARIGVFKWNAAAIKRFGFE